MNIIKKHKKKVIVVMSLGVIMFSVGGVKAALSEPGSQGDPLVTLSYVEKRIEEVKSGINEKINNLVSKTENNTKSISDLELSNTNLSNELNDLKTKENSNTSGATFEVVVLENGQTLIGKGGTEIILRAGSAKAITTGTDGLSDVTNDNDIKKDEEIPKNHLLIIPRDDGRGLYVSSKTYLMIRGDYEIK